MKKRLFITIFTSTTLFLSNPCHAWSLGFSVRNAVRSTLGFRLMAGSRTNTKAYAGRLGALAGFSAALSGRKPGFSDTKSDFPLNCKILDQELKKDSYHEPLNGKFSLSMQLRMPFDDQNLMHQQVRTYAYHINQNKPFPLQFGPISGAITYCSAQESAQLQAKKMDLDIDAHGVIKCEKGDNQCNKRLYLYSKLSKDFTRCLCDEFGPLSMRKPRSLSCRALYDALEFDADDVNPALELDDLALDVKLG